MRDIKFRGLRTDGKGWVYGYYYEYSGKHIICWQNHSDNATTDHFAQVIPESVSQFTGLFDKTGKEIYEKDICDFIDHPTNIQSCVADVKFSDGNFVDNYMGWTINNYGSEWTEVIGNIHDTPELLNPSNK